MNYNEFNWYFDMSSAPVPVTNTIASNPWSTSTTYCSAVANAVADVKKSKNT